MVIVQASGKCLAILTHQSIEGTERTTTKAAGILVFHLIFYFFGSDVVAWLQCWVSVEFPQETRQKKQPYFFYFFAGHKYYRQSVRAIWV